MRICVNFASWILNPGGKILKVPKPCLLGWMLIHTESLFRSMLDLDLFRQQSENNISPLSLQNDIFPSHAERQYLLHPHTFCLRLFTGCTFFTFFFLIIFGGTEVPIINTLSAAPQRTAYSKVPSQMAAHLRTGSQL